MRSKTIQELKYGPLRIVPDDQHLVVSVDDGLCCFVPYIMGNKCVFCHDYCGSGLESMTNKIGVIEYSALNFTL